MPRSLKNITIPRPTSGRSPRLSRPDWNKRFSIRWLVISLSVLLLLLCAVRTGHETLTLPVAYLVLGLDVLGILCIRHMSDVEYGLGFLPFLAVAALGILLQRTLLGGYYSFPYAFNALVLLTAMVVCVIFLSQKGYTHLFWKLLNAVTLLGAACIFLQLAAKSVGIRLDRLGFVSNLFFNAWEFTTAYRVCGIFSEPSMFAQLGLFSLYDYLFLHKNKWKAAFVTIALLLSTSALALLGVVLLAALFLLNMDTLWGVSRRTKFTVLGVTAAVAVLSLGWLLRADIYILQRALSGSSIGLRFFRSMDLYTLMSPLEKLIGIGLQNQERYLNYYHIVLAHDTYETLTENREFAGLLGYLLCTTGLAGLIAFVFPVYRLFRQGGLSLRVLVMLFVYCTLFSPILAHTTLVLYLMALYAARDHERLHTA